LFWKKANGFRRFFFSSLFFLCRPKGGKIPKHKKKGKQ